ncbi:MAG: prephenate dehydratase domain-containing protein [Coriobacteriales bacterium]|nr:prephenate dehydratase domain-containing protein [Coriobacteriales bacterium]
MQDLSEIRARIDSIDSQISQLLIERMEVSGAVAAYKKESGKAVYDPTRERANLAAAAERVPPELANYATVIQSVLMEASREAQNKYLGRSSMAAAELGAALQFSPTMFPKHAHVACQGVEGAYQQIACDRMFSRPRLTFYDKFEGVFEAVEQGLCDFGVLPIENSTAGSVNHVYDLMMRHEFHIVRTCRLKIDHNLLVKPGTKKKDVRIVYSHQQAISQCADYIAAIPNCQVHVCENTAKAAEMVSRFSRQDVAAIASRTCAELYGLEIADQSVQDNQNNYTRFACISKDLVVYPGADRSSLMIVTSNEPGSLYKVLACFYALDINLIKLESRPIPDRNFEWMFYFDIECAAASPEFRALMDALTDVCESFRYLGSYNEVI